MSRFFLWAKAFNRDWNDLPRRALWVAALCAVFFVCAKLFPFVAPFAAAALIAACVEKPVRALTKLFGGRKGSRAAAAGVALVLAAALLTLVVLLIALRLIEEGKALVAALPELIESFTQTATDWIETFPFGLKLPNTRLEAQLIEMLTGLGAQLAARAANLASVAAMGALKTATALPDALLFAVLTLLGAFYFCVDRERILAGVRRFLPAKALERSAQVRAGIGKCLLCQVRATIMLMFIIFIELTLGFSLLRLEYAVAFAAIVAVLDALPVIGAGLFLLPGAAYGFITGNLAHGIGFAALYAVTAVTCQLMEPKLIGRQLGLHPLSTMAAMYAGLRAMGVMGMLAGPLLLLACKVAMIADPEEAQALQKPLEPILKRRSEDAEKKTEK